MSNPHPNDILHALEWAVAKAQETAKTCEMVRLTVLPALKHQRDQVQRESRQSS